MITLINNTHATAKVGYLVAIDPTNPKAFIYATPNSVKAIGVVGEATAAGSTPTRPACPSIIMTCNKISI